MTKTLVERLEEQGRVVIIGVPDDFEWVSYAQAAAEITRLASRIEGLERALIKLRDCDWVITPLDRMDAVREIARQALSDKG